MFSMFKNTVNYVSLSYPLGKGFCEKCKMQEDTGHPFLSHAVKF
jgi:hypothetical protein